MNPTGILETAKATNPFKDLLNYGQSVWLDYIRRDLFTSGELKRLIDRRRPARHDLESRHFREGDRRQQALQRHSQVLAIAHGSRRHRAATKSSPFATFRMPPTACARLRQHKGPRRLCEPRSLAVSRPRHQGHHGRSAPLVESGRPRECHDQGSGHHRRHSRHSSN